MERRLDLVRRVVEWNDRPFEAMREIIQYEWDYEGIPFTLHRSHVENILRRFLSGELSSKDVEEWADFIEMRSDIDYEERYRDWLSDAIFILATPAINGELTPQLASELFSKA